MRALGYRDRDWVHPKAFLESERPRIKGLDARSRSLGMSLGCSEQSASGWAELTGVVLGALNCLMAPWWGLISAYNRP